MRVLILTFLLVLSNHCLLSQSLSETHLLRRILDRHSDLYDRAQDIHRLSSISIEGTQIQGDRSLEFLLWKKRPDQFRYRLSGPGGDVVCGYDGKLGWQRLSTHGVVELSDLDGVRLSALREEASFDGPLIDYQDRSYNRYRLLDGDHLIDGGIQSKTVEVLEPNERRTRYTIAMGTGYILKRVRLDPDGEVLLETNYSDYRMVHGFPFAFVVENRVRGQFVSRTEVENIVVNPGILSFYFRKPQN